MTVTLDVYAPDGTTLIDRLETARKLAWHDDLTSTGTLTFEFSAGAESGGSLLVQADRIVKVNVYGTTVFAGVVQTQRKSRVDNDVAVVTVTAPGFRSLLADALVYPEGGLADGLPRAATRYFGWTSGDTVFDDAAWAVAASHGPWSSNPFGNLVPPRQPVLWPADAASAELIWATHTGTDAITGLGTVAPGRVYFRKEFNTDEDHDVVWLGTANDEVTWYVDGQQVLQTVGPYQWSDFGQTPFRLPAGDHVLAAVGNNLERPAAAGGPDSGAWILGALLLADPDGQPATQNETWTVHRNGATGGTFRLKFDNVASTGPIAYNASAAVVKTALEDTHPSIEVTVTGTGSSGDPWVIEATGAEVAGVPHKLAYGTSALTGGATAYPIIVNTVDGAYAPLLIKTDTTWRHLPYPADVPGVNFGIILGRLYDEVVARGTALDALTITFGDAVDSSGQAWTQTFNLPISVGTNLEAVVAMAEDAGLTFHIDPDGSANFWDIGHLGVDRRSTVELEYGVNLTAIDHERDGRRYDTLLVETEGGFYQEVSGAPGTPEKEGFLSAGGFAGADDFAVFSAQALSDYATQPDRTTATFPQKFLADFIPYVAVGGRSNRLLASQDAVNWDVITNGPALTVPTTTGIFSIGYNPNASRFAVSASDLKNWRTDDFETWASPSSAATTSGECFAYSPELGVWVMGADDSQIQYSLNDGISWSDASPGVGLRDVDDLYWVPDLGLFVGLTLDSTTRMVWSADGINWSSTGDLAHIVTHMVWAHSLGKGVAISLLGDRVYTSTNGTSWTDAGVPTGIGNLVSDIEWSPELGLFVATRAVTTSGRIAWSFNGINWTAVGSSGLTSDMPARAVTWSADLGLFIVVAGNNSSIGGITTSPDGVNWTLRATTDRSLHAVVAGRIARAT